MRSLFHFLLVIRCMKNKKTAIISVFDKKNIISFACFLLDNDYQILSSGGTYKYLTENISNSNIYKIEDYTKFPEILGGRVKTLHPKIYGGILARTNVETDIEQLNCHDIYKIDLVIVNLYPFSQVVAKEDHTFEDAIENIDIGGVTLIRAAAKNYVNTTVVINPDDYSNYIELHAKSSLTEYERKKYAIKAFHYISTYDINISNYFDGEKEVFKHYVKKDELKYGCNPHQKDSAIYQEDGVEYPFKILNGKPGYINYIDAIQSWRLVTELQDNVGMICAASFKHTTPAGVGTSLPLTDKLSEIYGTKGKILNGTSTAFIRARNADPMSSFGDFIAISGTVDKETAEYIKKEVSDGIVAEGYDPAAIEILKQKKNGNYIILQGDRTSVNSKEFREVGGIVLSQNSNAEKTTNKYFDSIPTMEKSIPTWAKIDLIIANTTLKYTPSNSIVYAYQGQVIGVGAGQQNRVDCVKIAGHKADVWFLRGYQKAVALQYMFKQGLKRYEKVNATIQYINNDFTESEYILWLTNFEKNITEMITFISSEESRKYIKDNDGVSLASDAFFPFRDSIDQCSKRGVKYILQPGGSVADEAVVQACNDYNITMAMSGVRVFTH